MILEIARNIFLLVSKPRIQPTRHWVSHLTRVWLVAVINSTSVCWCGERELYSLRKWVGENWSPHDGGRELNARPSRTSSPWIRRETSRISWPTMTFQPVGQELVSPIELWSDELPLMTDGRTKRGARRYTIYGHSWRQANVTWSCPCGHGSSGWTASADWVADTPAQRAARADYIRAAKFRRLGKL